MKSQQKTVLKLLVALLVVALVGMVIYLYADSHLLKGSMVPLPALKKATIQDEKKLFPERKLFPNDNSAGLRASPGGDQFSRDNGMPIQDSGGERGFGRPGGGGGL